MDQVAVDPVAGEVHLRLDRGALADLEHPGDRWQGVQVDVRSDPRPEQPGIPLQPGRASGRDRCQLVLDPVASQTRRCTLPPRGHDPGVTPRRAPRISRAATAIRTGGTRKITTVRTTSHTGTVGTQDRSRTSWARVVSSISQASHRPAASVRSGSSASNWPSWVLGGIGGTVRFDRAGPGPRCSSAVASVPSRGLRYRSPTATSGYCSRSRPTTWAAVSDPPPKSKKSSLGEVTSAPSTSAQMSAIHDCSSLTPVGPAPVLGRGHGRASRSTLPEVLVGRSSTTARRGTSAAGIRSRSRASAVSES